MRILYLCNSFPYPPNKGEKIRAFHQLKHLGGRHNVHLLTLGKADEIAEHGGRLGEYCERLETFELDRQSGNLRAILGLASRNPLTLSFYRSAALQRRIHELAGSGRFDIVLAYTLAMAAYTKAFTDTPRVLDMVDVDSAKWAQYARYASFPLDLIYHLESRRTQRYEASLGSRLDRVLVTTRREAEAFSALGTGPRVDVIRNGICLDTFRRFDLPRATEPTLLFMGQMDYFANVDAICHFARTTFTELRRSFPELRLVIVGRSPTARVLALEQIPGIAVTGAVSDVRPFLARATIFVAPLRIAQGVQNKVLEAMASELPVVTTPAVMSGIRDGGLRDGEHLKVAGDDRSLGLAITELLRDRPQRRRMGAAARRQLSVAYTWATNMAALDETLTEVVEEQMAGARSEQLQLVGDGVA